MAQLSSVFGDEPHLLLFGEGCYLFGGDIHFQICPGKFYLPGHIGSFECHAQLYGAFAERYPEFLERNGYPPVQQRVSSVALYSPGCRFIHSLSSGLGVRLFFGEQPAALLRPFGRKMRAVEGTIRRYFGLGRGRHFKFHFYLGGLGESELAGEG